MKTEQIKRRLSRIEAEAAETLNVARVYDLVTLPDGREEKITPGKLEEYTAKGATLTDVIIHVPDKRPGRKGAKNGIKRS